METQIELITNREELREMICVKRERTLPYMTTYQVGMAEEEHYGEVTVALENAIILDDRIKACFPNLSDNDPVAEIWGFYPHNGSTLNDIPKELQGKGIGSAVLNSVLNDLVFFGTRFVYVSHISVPATNLFIKNGFQRLGEMQEYKGYRNVDTLVKLIS